MMMLRSIFIATAAVAGVAFANPLAARQAGTCADWAELNGGPSSACLYPAYQYTASPYSVCDRNKENCVAVCCNAVTPQLCDNWAFQHGM